MLLSDFKKLLAENSVRNIRVILPTGSKIPPHAHVTEVARIDKKYIDCGGTLRAETVCRLQTWSQDDTDHRLTAAKLIAILDKSAAFFQDGDFEVEIEHEAPFIAQFPVQQVAVDEDALIISLGIKHTACLAEDKCLPPNLNKPSVLTALPDFTKRKCC